MKNRPANTFEDGATIGGGLLGYDRMGRIAGLKSGSWPRKWSDPEQEGMANLLQALLIDTACANHPGGNGATPFLTAYQRQLHMLITTPIARGDLLTETLDVPVAVGRLAAAVVAADADKNISPHEAHAIRVAIRDTRDQLDEMEAALNAATGKTKGIDHG